MARNRRWTVADLMVFVVFCGVILASYRLAGPVETRDELLFGACLTLVFTTTLLAFSGDGRGTWLAYALPAWLLSLASLVALAERLTGRAGERMGRIGLPFVVLGFLLAWMFGRWATAPDGSGRDDLPSTGR